MVVLKKRVTNWTIVPGFPGRPFLESVFRQTSLDVMQVPSELPAMKHLGDRTLHLAPKADLCQYNGLERDLAEVDDIYVEFKA